MVNGISKGNIYLFGGGGNKIQTLLHKTGVFFFKYPPKGFLLARPKKVKKSIFCVYLRGNKLIFNSVKFRLLFLIF